MPNSILDWVKNLGADYMNRLVLPVFAVDDTPPTLVDGEARPGRLNKDNGGIVVHVANAGDIGGGGGGDATAANQVLGLTALDSIYDALALLGTEATSADILAAVNTLASGATLADLAAALAPLATQATQADILAALEAQAIDVGLIQTNVALLVPDVDAMKDSLASLDGKIPASPATAGNQAATNTLLAGGLPAALGAGGGVKVDGSGTPLPVSGTVTATLSGAVDTELPPAAALADAAANPTTTTVGACLSFWDANGSTWNRLRGSTNGIWVQGQTIAGTAFSSRPVVVGATDGTNARTILADTGGRQVVVGAAATGAAVTGSPVLVGGSDGTNAQAFRATSGGSQIVAFEASHVGPFGDWIACEPTPLMQKAFTLGAFVDQLDSTAVSGTGATADINANRLRLQNGTDAAGSALYTSVLVAQYRSGQGFDFRWTAAFAATAANSTQVVGFGTSTDGIFVGYNGTSYGILHRNAGVDTWIAQSSWNGDKCNGTGASGFNTTPSSLNVFRALVPFLGAGSIRVFLMDPVTGNWLLAHTIRYPNTSQSLEFSDPAFRFYARALSTTSTTNLTIYVGSYAALLIGKKGTRGAVRNFTNRKAVTTEVALFSVRNATTVNGDANTATFTIRWINGSNDGANGDVKFRFVLGATLGGSPSFTPKNGNTADNGVTLTSAQSVLSFDTAGTTVTGGEELYSITMARNSTTTPTDVSTEDYQLGPGQTLTISAVCPNGLSQDCAFTITGRED